MGFMEFIHSYPFISINIHLYPLKQSSVSNAMNIDLRCHPAFFSVTPPLSPTSPPRWRRTRGVPAAPRRRYRPAGPRGRCCSARASGPWRTMGNALEKAGETGKVYIYIILYAYIYITHIYIYII